MNFDNPKAQVLANTLDEATSKFLDNNKSPSPRVGELDNRGSHFYLALYWAQALAAQTENDALQAQFSKCAESLAKNEEKIVSELNAVQGAAVDIGGYYKPDEKIADKVMRPSVTLNEILTLI